ncbi:MAG: HD-GYP domain-containing protein [bacterium]
MDLDNLPYYNRLSFKFLISAAFFILIVEGILFYLSLQGMNARLVSIRNTVLETIPPVTDKVESMILPRKQIESIVWQYGQNIALMVCVIVAVVVSGLYFVVKKWFLDPISTAIEYNESSFDEGIQMIPDKEIPNDELGLLMESRNKMLQAIENIYSEDALESLCNAVDAKDQYTEGHSRRVGQLGYVLGSRMGKDLETCRKIQYAGTLHDIGKIGVPDRILNKEGKLTDEEFEAIKEHPVRGEQIIQFSNISDQVVAGIRHHHESYDGSGYPDGLQGTDIPLYGRILAVADAVDAMLSDRSYRDALPYEVVLEELHENLNNQFDPEIGPIAIELIEESQQQERDFLDDYLPSLISDENNFD